MAKKKQPTKQSHTKTPKHRLLVYIVAGIAGAIVITIIFALWCQIRPLDLEALQTQSTPYTDYGAADRAAEQLVLADKQDPSLNPDCGYQYLKQPQRVQRVMVLRHGLTNCPRQFGELARTYHEMGYAVLVTRIPEHGASDRMAPNFSRLSAEATLQNLNDSIDIAMGLGEDVDIMGLSAGANEVAYVATQRNDIHQAIIIDPIFTPTGIPTGLTRTVTGALLTIPNQFIWWSDKHKNLDGPTSAYYGWQSQPVGQFLRITEALYQPGIYPRSQHTVVITNENDSAVNNQTTDELAQLWRNNGVDVTAYRFPKSDKLNHDIIDPLQVGANTALSYPKLIELSTKNYAAHSHH